MSKLRLFFRFFGACAIPALPISVFIFAGCDKTDAAGTAHSQADDAPVPVVLAPLRVEAVQRTVEVVGTLWGDEDTTISNKVPGKVIAIYHDIGDRVKAGEPLAQLMRKDYALFVNQKERALQELLVKIGTKTVPDANFDVTNLPSVRKAKLELENAESKYQRGKVLHDQTPQLMSDQDFQDLVTARAVAHSSYDLEIQMGHSLVSEARTRDADLAVAQQALDDTLLRTPIPASGYEPGQRPDLFMAKPHAYVVAARMASVGELKNTITPMFRLVDDDLVKLRANVPERYVPEIQQIGQEADVFIEAYPGRPFQGRVSRINPQIDPQNRTFQVEIDIPNEEHLLPPGAFARALVKTHVDKRVVFAPADAVVTFAGVNKVYTVKDNKAVEIGVELGDKNGNWVEVIHGLDGSEHVAVKGIGKLATGVAVAVEQLAPSVKVK